jgi:hypothetical protein
MAPHPFRLVHAAPSSADVLVCSRRAFSPGGGIEVDAAQWIDTRIDVALALSGSIRSIVTTHRRAGTPGGSRRGRLLSLGWPFVTLDGRSFLAVAALMALATAEGLSG